MTDTVLYSATLSHIKRVVSAYSGLKCNGITRMFAPKDMCVSMSAWLVVSINMCRDGGVLGKAKMSVILSEND